MHFSNGQFSKKETGFSGPFVVWGLLGAAGEKKEKTKCSYKICEPLHRSKFKICRVQFGYHGIESDSLVCLVNLISKAHADVKLLDEVAYWVVGTLACRRREFKALCS